jgi:hypothetical protein
LEGVRPTRKRNENTPLDPRRARVALAARQVSVSKEADYVARIQNYDPVLFDIKDDLYAEETTVFLSSTSNGRSTLAYGSIKRRRDKSIVPAARKLRLDRFGVVSNVSDNRWEKGFAALAKPIPNKPDRVQARFAFSRHFVFRLALGTDMLGKMALPH